MSARSRRTAPASAGLASSHLQGDDGPAWQPQLLVLETPHACPENPAGRSCATISCGQTATKSAPAASRSFSVCMPQATPSDPNAAFLCVKHVARRIGDQHEIVRRRAGWMISFAIGGGTVAVDQIGVIRQKPPDDGAFVRFDVAAEDVREAMSDASPRQQPPDRRRRVGGDDGERADPGESAHHVDHAGNEVRRIVGVELREKMTRHLLRMRFVPAEAPQAEEQIILEQAEIFLLRVHPEVERSVCAGENLPRRFARLDERAVEIEEDRPRRHGSGRYGRAGRWIRIERRQLWHFKEILDLAVADEVSATPLTQHVERNHVGPALPGEGRKPHR